MAAYDKAVEDGEKHPAKKVSRMKGFYRCCVYKWKKSREREKWTLLCRACQKASRTSGCDEGFHGRLQEVQEQSPRQNGHGVDANPPARVDSTGF